MGLWYVKCGVTELFGVTAKATRIACYFVSFSTASGHHFLRFLSFALRDAVEKGSWPAQRAPGNGYSE